MSRKTFTFITCLLLAACNLPNTQPAPSAPQAWFDMPLPDTVVFPLNPCQVIAHGASPDGIALFELSINGASVSNVPASDSKQTLATLKTDCLTLIPGKNLIEVRAQDIAGEWSDSAQTTVIFAQRDEVDATPSPRATDTTVPTLTATSMLTVTRPPTLTPTPTRPPTRTFTPTHTSTLTPTPTRPPTRTFTPTRTPTFTPTPRTTTGGVAVERVSTNLVYLGGASCGTQEVTILARATAPNGIKVVVLFYRFQTINSSTEFQSVSMKPIGGDLYERTLNPTSLLGGSIPFDEATLQYQIVVQQNDGDTSIRIPVLSDITVKACGRVTTSCSSYTDERTCIANGCNWVSIPGVVPIFECRNP